MICQKCREHGKIHMLKDHSSSCPSKDCRCEYCKSVESDNARPAHNQNQQRQLDQECFSGAGEQLILSTNRNRSEKRWRRLPKCRKCEGHKVISYMRGHFMCPYGDCNCESCQSVTSSLGKIANSRFQRRHLHQKVVVPQPIRGFPNSSQQDVGGTFISHPSSAGESTSTTFNSTTTNQWSPLPISLPRNLAIMMELKQLIARNPIFNHLAATHSLNMLNTITDCSQSASTCFPLKQ